MVDFFRKLNFVCDCSYIEYADAHRGAAVSFIGEGVSKLTSRTPRRGKST